MIFHTGENHIICSYYNPIGVKTMPENNFVELINLPLPLTDHQILQRRQLIRQELTQKVNQLRLQTPKRIFRIKCPCNYDICNHMEPLTANLMLSWCPLDSELGFFLNSSHIDIW